MYVLWFYILSNCLKIPLYALPTSPPRRDIHDELVMVQQWRLQQLSFFWWRLEVRNLIFL